MIISEEEKKKRYQNIVYRLRIINSKIDDLNSSISSLENTTKRSLLINDEPYNSEKMSSAKMNLNSIFGTINGSIIPSLINKIYQ